MSPEELFKLLRRFSRELEEADIPLPESPSDIREATVDDLRFVLEALVVAADEGDPGAVAVLPLTEDVELVAISDVDTGDTMVFALTSEKVYAWR